MSIKQQTVTPKYEQHSASIIPDLLREGPRIVDATINASESMNRREAAFLSENRSPAGRLRSQIIEGMLARGEITSDEVLSRLAEVQKDDTDETVRLHASYAASKKARSDVRFKTGLGIGVGSIGVALLVWVLDSIFSRTPVISA